MIAGAAFGAPGLFTWKPHPEVWLLVVALAAMYFYVTRVTGPKAVPPGEPIITRRQAHWYFAGVVLLWIAADWPIHDWAENYLYSVHMLQHLILTFIVPPMFLLATPEWFARLALGKGRVYRLFRFLVKPLVAGPLFMVTFALSHWPWAVSESVKYSGFHFSVHVVIVTTAVLAWTCVCGPFEEMRISPIGQMFYLFLWGLVPTVPGGWLVFAEGVVYKVYIHPYRVLGMNAIDDQQLAGFIMKVVGGLYLIIVAIVIFFRWNHEQAQLQEAQQRAEDEAFWAGVEAAVAFGLAPGDHLSPALTTNGDRDLTYEKVQAAFDRSPAPHEPGGMKD